MRDVYNNQLADLKTNVVKMASDVIDLYLSTDKALFEGKSETALCDIEEKEKEINFTGKSLDDDCAKLCLFQRPLASDLRFVSATQRIVMHLMKIAHQIAEIADIVRNMDEDDNHQAIILDKMANETKDMVISSITAYQNNDKSLADMTIKRDDDIDSYFISIRKEVIGLIKDNKISPDLALDIFMISKYYERIGDHSESLAKEVINI